MATMADTTNATPAAQTAADRNQRTPSATANPHPRKRNHHRKTPSQSQIDGTVSDSVTTTTASLRSQKDTKQRQQSVAIGALPQQNGTKANSHKPRPVSFGGNMLPATPLKEQAYAGPTFQASPAPSSLPVPRFFSKSVPNVAAQSSLEARMAGRTTPKEEASPESDVVVPARDAQQSPLDLFFKADKAEKDKSRSGSVQSPEMAARHAVPATEPRNLFQQSNKSAFLSELDGDDAAMPSPKTVPQNNRRPDVQAESSPSIRIQSAGGESEREQSTRALKDLLFNNTSAGPPTSAASPDPTQRACSNSRAADSPFATPPLTRSTSGPSTPAPSSEQQNHYSLHYGNRNLSPLFKAARGDTPSRPSGLRQQELASDMASNLKSANGMPPQSRQLPQIDPNSFSRNYLDRQIHDNRTPSLPQLPIKSGSTSIPNRTSEHPSSPKPGASGGGTASPRTSGISRDIKTMEDDLRRKLNILSN